MLIRADARSLPLRDGCVQCVVTSPPYWALRVYPDANQIGLEPTPQAFVATLVEVFREVWRVLRNDGTCWIVLGDSYASGGRGGDSGASGLEGTTRSQDESKKAGPRIGQRSSFRRDRRTREDVPHKGAGALKPKDLIGIPWMVAFALRDAGWYLRSEIIWHKTQPMPESVTDRPTKAHEQMFLLSKSSRYFYNADAIKEPVSGVSHDRGAGANPKARGVDGNGHGNGRHKQNESFSVAIAGLVERRNKRDVWTIPTEAYAAAHFATFPQALVTPCLLAGSRPGDLVLDPFLGSGTVGAVAARLGRRWVGTDLSYQDLSKARTAQRGIPFVRADGGSIRAADARLRTPDTPHGGDRGSAPSSSGSEIDYAKTTQRRGE